MKGKLLTALVVIALVLGTVLVACDDGSHANIVDPEGSDPAAGTKVTIDKYYIPDSVKGQDPIGTNPLNGDNYINGTDHLAPTGI